MIDYCEKLHQWANTLPVFRFPFDEQKIPLNGIYLLFENGENAHGGRRIVRIGTHTGKDQLRSRLRQHFLTENKDRSIFRKNIGRSLLAQSSDPFLEKWELDLTPQAARERYSAYIDIAKQNSTEKEVSQYLRKNFSFAVLSIEDKAERLRVESRIISTVSLCTKCKPSKNWLGNFSPKEKIRESGLWLVNELYKTPLSRRDWEQISSSKSL